MTQMKKTIAMALAVATALVVLGASPAHAQQPSPTPRSPLTVGQAIQAIAKTLAGKPKLTIGQKRWLELLPVIEKYDEARFEAAVAHANKLRNSVSQRLKNLKTRQFVEEMVGLEAMYRASRPRQQVTAFIKSRYSAHVLDADAFAKAIKSLEASHHQKMIELTNECLVACKLDLNFDPKKVRRIPLNLKDYWAAVENQQRRLADQLYETATQSALAAGAGLTAGAIGESIGSSFGRDEHGNETLTSFLLGLGAGAVADHIASEAAMKSMNTREKMTRKAVAVANEILRSAIGQTPKLGGVENGFIDQLYEHEKMMLIAIADHLRVDRKWAAKHLPKRFSTGKASQ